jgi:hypothetical protein
MKAGRKPSCFCGECEKCRRCATQSRLQLRRKLKRQGIELEDLRRYNGGPRAGAGRHIQCECGKCHACKQRAYRHRLKFNLPYVSPDQLEKRLVQYFIDKGWETTEWIRPNSVNNLIDSAQA